MNPKSPSKSQFLAFIEKGNSKNQVIGPAFGGSAQPGAMPSGVPQARTVAPQSSRRCQPAAKETTRSSREFLRLMLRLGVVGVASQKIPIREPPATRERVRA
jgi:hypothetical protein